MLFESSIPSSFFKQFNSIGSSFMQELEEKYHHQGWYTFFDALDVENTKKQLEQMSLDVDYILSIGVGGSYTGIQALVNFLGQQDKWLFLGPSLDTQEVNSILEKLKDKKVGVLIISKGGTTFEIDLFLKITHSIIQNALWVSTITSSLSFYNHINHSLGRTTLLYTIEKSTGGRYSLFSILGLVALYLLKQDWTHLAELIKIEKQNFKTNFHSHPSFYRGVSRFLLQNLYGVSIEVLSIKDKKMTYIIKWLEQLFAESDGKEGKGLYIGQAFYPQDAHSIGQIMSEGKKIVAETFYLIEDKEIENNNLSFLKEIGDTFIAGIRQDRLNTNMVVQTYQFTNSITDIWKLFFYEMLAVSLECYLLKVNPFNQPGVEGYKKCIHQLLNN